MQFIPAKERFSTHAKSVNVDPSVLSTAVSRLGPSPDDTTFRRLAGGFMNANYLASVGGDRFVVRVYSTEMATAERECDLLRFLASHPILVPKVMATFEVENRPVAILEFIDGITLEDRLLTGEPIALSLYHEIGAQLAEIHRVTFSRTGLVGPHLAVGGEYENLAAFLRQYIEDTLSMLLARPDRLSQEVNHRLLRLVQDKWDVVSATEPRRQLCHCDFNPKNLLVSSGSPVALLAVIDWEFCLSGNGLGDLGNFFRFEYDYPTGAREEFVAGYRSVVSDLPRNWVEVTKLLDLANMCSFLERPEDYQKSFRTARVVIESTLEEFGY